jgi:Type IV secretion-system coupling protein DNA-binding domain
MHAYRPRNALTLRVPVAAGWLWAAPALVWAQASPFMTGATALQTNILAWLTPIAIILVMVLGAMAMANRMILRCSGSEHGGTSQFASRLIGEREVSRIATSRSRRAIDLFPTITRAEHRGVELAVMGSQIEQLPDLSGYLKLASSPEWRRVRLHALARSEREVSTTPAGNILNFPRGLTARPAADILDRDRTAAHDGFEPD